LRLSGLNTVMITGVSSMSDFAKADDVVSRAIEREAALRKELDELRVFLSVYHKLRGQSGDYVPILANTADTDPTVGAQSAPDSFVYAEPPPPPKGMRQPEFVAFVRAMMLEHGRPMQQHEIMKGFKKRGRHVGGNNELSNLKAKLWRAKEHIVSIAGSGYWPIDVACPAVSYTPPDDEL